MSLSRCITGMELTLKRSRVAYQREKHQTGSTNSPATYQVCNCGQRTHPLDHRNLTQNVCFESKLEGTNKLHVKFQFQCPSGGACSDWGYMGTPDREHTTCSQDPPDWEAGVARRGHDLQGLTSLDLGSFCDIPLGTQNPKSLWGCSGMKFKCSSGRWKEGKGGREEDLVCKICHCKTCEHSRFSSRNYT